MRKATAAVAVLALTWASPLAQDLKIPYMLIVGGKDEAAGTVSVRERSKGDLGAMPLERFVEQAKREVESHGREMVKV